MQIPTTPQTVLLVDDEDGVRDFLSRLLRMKGYSVFEAADGEEAFYLFRQHSETIGLLLTDLTMPRKNGLELAREITALRPDLPVVFMSGNYQDWHGKLGSLPCLQKPFEVGAVLKEVAKAYQQSARASA